MPYNKLLIAGVLAGLLHASIVDAASAKAINLKSILNAVKNPAVTGDVAVRPTSDVPVAVSGNEDLLEAVEVTGNRRLSSVFILDAATIRVGDVLNPFRISRAVKNVQALGVFSEVGTEVRKGKKGRILRLIVAENPVIGSIRFDGARSISQISLEKAIRSRRGDLLNLNDVRRDSQAIQKAFADSGYPGAKVLSFSVPKQDGDELVFFIAENVLQRVEVTGNEKTKDYVILREMDTKPGDPIKDSQIREDLRRIYNLGFFTNIVPEFYEGTTLNGQVLRLNIEERPSNATFTLGGGFSPTAGGSVFSDIYWDNLFGTGQLASVKAQLGRASTYSLRYMNPWMWDKRKSFSITAWLRDGQVDQLIPNSSTIGYRNERSRGLEMEVGWPFSYEFLSSHRFKYESVLLKDVDKSYTITSYALTLAYDTRDVRFNPLSGEYYTLTFEDSLPVYKSSLEYYRIVAELRNFTKVAEQQTIATRLVLGYINSPSISDTDLFSREYFRMGGSSTVRGWNDFYPFGTGNKEALFSIEYRYVFNDTLTAVAFVDVGSATSGSIFDTKQYHLGKGVGIRFTVPALGPIRLDWGIGDYGDSILHASIGHTF